MLQSMSDLLERPYEEAISSIRYDLMAAVFTRENYVIDEKINMLMYVVKNSNDTTPVSNKEIFKSIGFVDNFARLSPAMGIMQRKLQGFIGTTSTTPRRYYLRYEVERAFADEYEKNLRQDILDFLNGLSPQQNKSKVLLPKTNTNSSTDSPESITQAASI